MTLAACIATLLALAYADQPTSRTEPFTEGVAILAPLDAVADARKLWLAEDRDDLAKRASSLGYRLLETKAIDRDTVNLVVHADYVEQGGYALAVEVAKYLKGRDPLRTLDLADFPEQLRAALEPAFRTLAGGSLGANRSMRFAIEPLLYVGVEDPTAPRTIGAPSLYDLAPNLTRPATHPSRLDGGRDGSRNTDIHSSFVAQTKAEAASLENATVVYLRASNDMQRARWSQALWKAVEDRVGALWTEFAALQREEGLRVFREHGLLGELQSGRAVLSGLPPTTRRAVEAELRRHNIAIRDDLVVVLRTSQWLICFESAPNTWEGRPLSQFLFGSRSR